MAVGHRNVSAYGWSFFLLALEEREEARSRSISDMAVAFRVALGADRQDFMRFIETGM